MKKLVSLIFAITLLTSVNIHARAIDSDVVPSRDDSNVTTIRKATMATYEQSFTWDEFTTIGNPNGGSNWTECDMQFYRNGNTSSRPHLRLCFCVKDDGARTYYSSSGKAYYFPQNGTYTIGTTLTLFTVGAYNNSWSYNWDSQFWPDNTKTYWLKSGTVTVSDGHRRNEVEPYIVVNSTANVNENGYTESQGTYISARFTIGEPLYTYNINVATNNASLGTVSKNKSSVTEGGSVTLKATETSGTFQGWSLDGGTTIIEGTNNQLTYSPTLGADAGSNGQTFTYTAVFVPNSAPQYTITVQADNDDYCTVSGGGTYFAGTTNVTISSASKSEHLYIFDKWQIKDGEIYKDFDDNDENPLTITITGNATYKAIFHVAKAGKITAVPDDPLHGYVTGGSDEPYEGGTEVTLEAVAYEGWEFSGWDDGVYDNPRTVYVDDDAKYIANFDKVTIVEVYGAMYRDRDDYHQIIGTSASGYEVDIRILKGGTFEREYTTSDYYYEGMSKNGNNITVDMISNAIITLSNDEHVFEGYVQDDAEILYHVKMHFYKPLWMAFSWDDSNDVIVSNAWADGGDKCSSSWYPYGTKSGIVVKARKQGYAENNYVCLYFITTHTKMYSNNKYGPNAGTYNVQNPGQYDTSWEGKQCDKDGYDMRTNFHAFWTMSNDDVIVGYRADDYYEGACTFKSYWGDMGNDLTPYAKTYFGTSGSQINVYAEVEEGKDGKMFLKLFRKSDNALLITIGSASNAPVATTYDLAWDANGGELSGTYTAAGSMNEGATITAPTAKKDGYTFSKWRDVTNDVDFSGTMPANDVTYVAQWNIVNYAITYEGLNGAENSNPTSYNVESETITLAAPGARDGYRFTGWTDNDNSNAAVTQIIGGTYGDRHFTANWKETSYTVNVKVDEAGHGTVTADKDKVDEGGSVTVTYTPDSYSSINNETVEGFYEFVQWSDDNTDNPRTIDPVNADINLTAVTRLKTTLTLRDDMPDDYYDDMAGAYYGDGTSPVTLTEVTCKRSFAANQWTVFSLPFGLDLDALENSQLDGKVYHYIGATGNADEGLNVNFEHETDEIIAGMPYLFYSPSVVKDPVFSNVTLKEALVDTDNDKQAGYTTGKTGDVRFIATNRIKSLQGGDKSVIFLSKSRLYYPNAAGNKLRPFRGFFKVPAEQQGVTPRLRIVADGQTVTEIEAVVEDGQQATVRKYIENGTLVIEREGVRYDATGAKIN